MSSTGVSLVLSIPKDLRESEPRSSNWLWVWDLFLVSFILLGRPLGLYFFTTVHYIRKSWLPGGNHSTFSSRTDISLVCFSMDWFPLWVLAEIFLSLCFHNEKWKLIPASSLSCEVGSRLPIIFLMDFNNNYLYMMAFSVARHQHVH